MNPGQFGLWKRQYLGQSVERKCEAFRMIHTAGDRSGRVQRVVREYFVDNQSQGMRVAAS